MAIYMKWDTLKGAVSADGYDGWINLDNVSYEARRPTSVESGIGMEGRHVDQPYVQDVLISKRLDRASTGLMNLLVKSAMGTDVQIDYVDQGAGSGPPVLRKKVTLVEAFITNYGVTVASGGGTETLTISFGQMAIEYTHKNAAGKDEKIRASLNVGEGEVG